MKRIIFNLLAAYCLLFTAGCNSGEPSSILSDKGFLEYQYDYQATDENGETVTKQAYERVNINRAFFVVNHDAVLPEPLPSLNFRQVDVYLFSDEFAGINAASSGASYVKIQLWDTLAVDANPDRLLSYSYMIRTEAGLLSDIGPACMAFTANMVLQQGETDETYYFKKQISGELGKRVNVFDLENGQYEILANGLFESKIYNFHYVGEIKKELNAPEFITP